MMTMMMMTANDSNGNKQQNNTISIQVPSTLVTSLLLSHVRCFNETLHSWQVPGRSTVAVERITG